MAPKDDSTPGNARSPAITVDRHRNSNSGIADDHVSPDPFPHRCMRIAMAMLRMDDEAPVLAAASRSRHLTEPWNPVIRDADDFQRLALRSALGLHMVFLVRNRADGQVVGKVSLYNILRGPSQSAAVGYDAFLPYAGTGRMTEALRLLIDHAFIPVPHGLGLHRLEINVPPENSRSAALARRAGFRLEGNSPRFQRLHGAWRDCERYALTSEERAPLTCCRQSDLTTKTVHRSTRSNM